MEVSAKLLLILPFAICSAGIIPVYQNSPSVDANGVLVVYFTRVENVGIKVHLAMDSFAGVGFAVMKVDENNTISHCPVFYKFSGPSETIFYNFQTHQSVLNSYFGLDQMDN